MNNNIKRCINCGRKLPIECNFCQYCGVKQPSNDREFFTESKSSKEHQLHLLVWTYFMVFIALTITSAIGGHISNQFIANFLFYSGIGMTALIAIIIDFTTIKQYKKGSIISMILNGFWIVLDLYSFIILFG